MSPGGAPPSASFDPGRGAPAEPGDGVGRADRAPRSPPDAKLAAGPGEAPARWACGGRRGRGRSGRGGSNLGAEAPTRKLRGEVERFGKGKTALSAPS